MVLKALGIVGFFFVFAIGARANSLDAATCGRVEKLFTDLEDPLTCEKVRHTRVDEFEKYRPMCYGCDPNYGAPESGQLQTVFIKRDNAAKNVAFGEAVESRGGPSMLDGLNRYPSSRQVLNAIYPDLNCADAAFKSAHVQECKEYGKLWDDVFAPNPENAASGKKTKRKKKDAETDGDPRQAAEDELFSALTDSRTTVQKAIDSSNEMSAYRNACNAANGSFKKASAKYNGVMGSEKKKLWTNLLRAVGGERGCFSVYVDDLPEFWCGKGELAQSNKDACLKKLAADPNIYEKFKAFTTDVTVLTARLNQKSRALGSAPETRIQPIDNKALKPIGGSLTGKDQPGQGKDEGTKPAEKSGNGG